LDVERQEYGSPDESDDKELEDVLQSYLLHNGRQDGADIDPA
jgi:hypothetical protein